MKTITLFGDFITLEELTRWIRTVYTVVLETDKPIGDNEIERVLTIVPAAE